MKTACSVLLMVGIWTFISTQCLFAGTPKNLGVTIDGQASDVIAALASDEWHTITASYRYSGNLDLLTNTYLVICRNNTQLSGFYLGYNIPRNELAIVKHGFWNDTEAIGSPGETGKIIENDQGYLDCENTKVVRNADLITVEYRVKFKKNALTGNYSLSMYSQDKADYDGWDNVGSVVIDKDPGVFRTDMPKQWSNSLRPIGRTSSKITFSENGKAKYVIAIPKNAKDIAKKAAQDIGVYFKLISRANFAVVSEDKLPKGIPYISLGRTRLLGNSKAVWKNTDLGAEGYAIEVIGRNVFLYGGRGRGLMNAVYSMLEEDMGCRWYSTSSTDTPSMTDFSVRLVTRKFVPILELRDPFIYSMHDPTWSLRNKTNSPLAPIPSAWGGSLRYQYMGHTYATYFPPQEYFAEHPEYYALVNGKHQTTQLCHTNEDVIRLSIEKTCRIFRENPEVTVTAIGPNDGRGFCDCPACTKLNDENGGRSGSFFYFVNRIAEGVKKEFPNNHLISLAYLDYAQPPTHLEVDPYIIIQLYTDSHAWKYQFCFEWESEDFQRMIKAWNAVHAKIYVWDYAIDYVHYLVPMANWPVVADNTRFNIKNGARGIMYECESSDNDEMRGWVWAKQLWDQSRDTKKLLKDFVFGYYKESAQPLWDYQMMMWDFWEKWHKIPHKCGIPSDNPLLNNLHCSYAPDGPMFTTDFMMKMRQYLAQAESLAKSGDILARVKKAKISLLYLELSQNLGYYTEFGDFVNGKSIRKSRTDKAIYKQYLDEFIDLCKKNELAIFGIPITFEKITTKWQSCIDVESSALAKIDMPVEWVFKTDPDDKGVTENWHQNQKYYDATVRKAEFGGGEASIAPLEKGLSRLHINRGVGWEQQGFPGFDGYGWYFQSIEIPDELFAKNHLYLYFLGVNEQVWVYVNGQFAFERTYVSTGKTAGDLWATPFSSDIKPYLKQGVRNGIAIRVTHSSGLGGIWLPATLLATDEECTTAQLDKYRY